MTAADVVTTENVVYSAAASHSAPTFSCQSVGACGALTWESKSFDLVQFHYHTPAEHTINGLNPAMVLHMVHQNADDSSYAVYSVLFDTTETEETEVSFERLTYECLETQRILNFKSRA